MIIKNLLKELETTKSEISKLKDKKRSINDDIDGIVIDLLQHMLDKDMFKMIFVTNEETVTDLIENPNLKPHRRSGGGVYLDYVYMGEGDYKAIKAEILSDELHFNYFNTCNHRDSGYFFKLPIEVLSDYSLLLPLVEKEFEVKYTKLQNEKEKKKQKQIEELENRLKRLKDTV